MQNSPDSQWTFEEGSTVTLVCTISPYTGVLTLRFNFTVVYACTGSKCVNFSRDQDNFSFQFDTDNGIFTWTIHKVGMELDDKQFECDDGKNNTMHTAKVKGKFSPKNVSNDSTYLFLRYYCMYKTAPVIIKRFSCSAKFENENMMASFAFIV